MNLILLPIAVFLLACSVTLAAESRPPNIVIVFVDDLGYGDIGPFGATKQRTPHLDRMADEGMKLTSFYAAPVCSVSRAQLLTGCYGARVSVPGVYFPGNRNGLNPDESTIAERLKLQGYRTMCIGKWHVGDQPEFLPTNQGFDHYFGIPYSNDMQRVSAETGQRVVPLLRDGKVAELLTDDQQSRIIERYTNEAMKFITANQDTPFLLYYPHTAVHTPIWPGEAFRGKSNNGRFGDWVEEVDWSVGQLLDKLVELKIAGNTLVIFTSDNGPWLSKGSDGGSSGPLRGGKGSTWEGGVRVPTIAWWPGKINPGSVCDTIAGTIDLLPTAVSLAGALLPAEPEIDGRDISPLLFGQTTKASREAHYYFAGYNLQAVRQGPWKLAIKPQPEAMGQSTLADARDDGPRLYNLEKEIGERTNVADQHPDVVASLQSLIADMNRQIGGISPTARRPAGSVAEPRDLYPMIENQTRPKKPKAMSPRHWQHLPNGAALVTSQAPQVGGRAFKIVLKVTTNQPDAMILAHGGRIAGYAIFIQDGRVHFLVRNGGGEEFTQVVVSEPFVGEASIMAELASDGSMKLQVDDIHVTGKSATVIKAQPQEDFCLGHDNGNPVTPKDDYPRLIGTLTELEIIIE